MGIRKLLLKEEFIDDLIAVKKGREHRVARPGHYRMYRNDEGNVIVEFFESQKIETALA